ncbi:MAG: 30S ribosome-binding factor RbfA [Christensenellales bacterium]|jgi:ribosome-binding factor A
MARIRMERINEEVKKAISEVIQQELKDPQISQICSVTSCEVTGDLKYAKVYVSVYDTEKRQEKSLQTLNRAAGFITREMGKRLDLRRLPQLIFKLDTNMEYGSRMASLIDEIARKDKESRGGDE